MKAIIRKLNSAQLARLDIPKPPPGHVLVKNEYAGVSSSPSFIVVFFQNPLLNPANTTSQINFIDVYYRDGLYPLQEGGTLGAEAGGFVYDCEESLKNKWLNKKVVFFHIGCFAEYTSVPVAKLIEVPDDISIPSALALTTMGLTAHYLCFSTYPIKKNDYVLVHAAGSGTGKLVVQVASKICGANVVGTASTKKISNVPLPRERVMDYTGFPTDLTSKLRALTPNNRGFDVVYDGVGKDTSNITLESCRSRGMAVFFVEAVPTTFAPQIFDAT